MKKIIMRALSTLCAVAIILTSPITKYADFSYINNVYATGLEIPLTLGAEAVVDYLVAFFSSVAVEEAIRNRESIAEAYSAYLDRQAESIPDVNEACLQFYDISKGQTVLVPWSEVTSSLQNYHDYAVDTLTDVYVKYCPQLLGSMKEFVAEVLAGDVYVEGLSETIVDSEIVTASDITNQWSGHEYTFSSCIVRGPLNCRKCGYKGEYVYDFFQEINFPCAFEFSEGVSTGGYVSYSCYRLANGAIYPYVFKYSCTCPACGYSFTQGYNGYWLINFSTNVPIFSSYEAVETYFRTGTGYENALNFGTSIDDNITANTDLPPFYKTWQQEQWERVANAPDIGIGSYGYGVDSNGTEWADDIPWVGLDSLRQYAEAIPDTYDKVVDNVLSGNYDSNKDIPETYTDAWEDAVGNAWANVQIADSLGSGGEENPDIDYPGNDVTIPPGEGWEWRGPKDKGSWYNPETGETLHPDLDHPKPEGAHWDYIPYKNGPQYRVYPDGTIISKYNLQQEGGSYMTEQEDWRLRGQEEYLQNANFQLCNFIASKENGDHTHCEFCWHKFMEEPDDIADCSQIGYRSEDGKYWVCVECAKDFKQKFNWQLSD